MADCLTRAVHRTPPASSNRSPLIAANGHRARRADPGWDRKPSPLPFGSALLCSRPTAKQWHEISLLRL